MQWYVIVGLSISVNNKKSSHELDGVVWETAALIDVPHL